MGKAAAWLARKKDSGQVWQGVDSSTVYYDGRNATEQDQVEPKAEGGTTRIKWKEEGSDGVNHKAEAVEQFLYKVDTPLPE
jgi:hypothetical protein